VCKEVQGNWWIMSELGPNTDTKEGFSAKESTIFNELPLETYNLDLEPSSKEINHW
jgi:hypothetical protein